MVLLHPWFCNSRIKGLAIRKVHLNKRFQLSARPIRWTWRSDWPRRRPEYNKDHDQAAYQQCPKIEFDGCIRQFYDGLHPGRSIKSFKLIDWWESIQPIRRCLRIWGQHIVQRHQRCPNAAYGGRVAHIWKQSRQEERRCHDVCVPRVGSNDNHRRLHLHLPINLQQSLQDGVPETRPDLQEVRSHLQEGNSTKKHQKDLISKQTCFSNFGRSVGLLESFFARSWQGLPKCNPKRKTTKRSRHQNPVPERARQAKHHGYPFRTRPTAIKLRDVIRRKAAPGHLTSEGIH